MKLDLRAQLPPPGPARVATLAALALGGLVAIGLPVLIALFLLSALGGPR